MAIKLVFIGCGQIGNFAHLPALAALQSRGIIDVVGVCDADAGKAEAAARKFSIPNAGTDWRRLVEDTGARTVSVCLPPGPNASVSIEALEAGLHVICEKPPGRS